MTVANTLGWGKRNVVYFGLNTTLPLGHCRFYSKRGLTIFRFGNYLPVLFVYIIYAVTSVKDEMLVETQRILEW